MDAFNIIGLLIIALIMISIAVGHRLLKRPRGIGPEKRRYLGKYLQLCRHYRPHDYEWKYMAHQRANIVWFDPPLVEEFMNRARALRDYLIEQERDPKEAVDIWGTLIEKAPYRAVATIEAPVMVREYDILAVAS